MHTQSHAYTHTMYVPSTISFLLHKHTLTHRHRHHVCTKYHQFLFTLVYSFEKRLLLEKFAICGPTGDTRSYSRLGGQGLFLWVERPSTLLQGVSDRTLGPFKQCMCSSLLGYCPNPGFFVLFLLDPHPVMSRGFYWLCSGSLLVVLGDIWDARN